jgi:hypothetical protein
LSALASNLFQPSNNDLFIQWICHGLDYVYASGRRLDANNFSNHHQNGWPFLMDEATHFIRTIVYSFKISITRFPALWNCFTVLLLRCYLKKEEFLSSATLVTRFFWLPVFDRHIYNASFSKFIMTPYKYGFFDLLYSVSDDSKHMDRTRPCCFIVVGT